jgi:uncharacterized protein
VLEPSDNTLGGSPSVRKVQVLVQLQRVDTALDHARERLSSVHAELADSSALAQVTAEHEVVKADLHRKATEQRDLELEVEDLRDKLATLEKKLYGGTVHNPKELSGMADEAKQYRNLISSREDRLIGIYDVVEAATTALAKVAARLKATRRSHAENMARLSAERNELQTAIAEHERQRAALMDESDAQSLRIYEGLRRTRNGLAVAEVAQRTCQGCRVSLPINEEIRARTSEELVLCQSCGRILHAGL